MLEDDLGGLQTGPDARDAVSRVIAWFEASGVDIAELIALGQLEQIGGWQTTLKLKNDDGTDRFETVNQAKWSISPAWESGPTWPLVAPAPTMNVKYGAKREKPVPDGWRTVAVLPDIQAPFVDWDAVDVALSILAAVRPDVVVLVGDNLDFAGLSRFRQMPGFASSAQAGVDMMAWLCAQVRSTIGPDAEIHWIEGNHEARLPNMILDNAAGAYGLRRARLPDEDVNRPVLTVANLCRLEDFGVEYHQGYPGAQVWFQPITDAHPVRVTHGRFTSRTAAKRYLDEGATTIFGHVHSREWEERRLADGRIIHAMSPGALCLVDGSVPGVVTSYDEDGAPLRQPVNWQQGIVVGHGDGDTFVPEMVSIDAGRAIYGGRTFDASGVFAEHYR